MSKIKKEIIRTLKRGISFAMFVLGIRYYVATDIVWEQIIYLMILGFGFYWLVDMEIEDKKH